MTDKTICAKVDECPKVGMVLDKDLDGDWQYAQIIRAICSRCPEKQEAK